MSRRRKEEIRNVIAEVKAQLDEYAADLEALIVALAAEPVAVEADDDRRRGGGGGA